MTPSPRTRLILVGDMDLQERRRGEPVLPGGATPTQRTGMPWSVVPGSVVVAHPMQLIERGRTVANCHGDAVPAMSKVSPGLPSIQVCGAVASADGSFGAIAVKSCRSIGKRRRWRWAR